MFSKGSEWRKWDLHVHTPASLDHKYGGNCDAKLTKITNHAKKFF